MDITIRREAALKSLQPINNIVERKHTLPILANVLLTVQDDQLLLTGTDTDLEFVGKAQPEAIHLPGTTTVSARKLFDICRTFAEDTVLRLLLQGNALCIRAHDSCFTLNTLSSEAFPNIAVMHYPVELVLLQRELRYLLAKTYFAMGVQDTRHYLNGALLELEQAHLHCVAMDGHRLALASIANPAACHQATQIILPRKSVIELMRLLAAEGDSTATLQLADNQLRVVTDHFVLTSKLINAQYPNYRRLIVRGKHIAIVDRETMRQALVRVAILSHEKMRGIRCYFEQNKLTCRVHNAEQEEAQEIISINYQGDSITTAFNVTYLLDVLSAIQANTVRMTLMEASTSVVLEAEPAEGCVYIVMPMRL